MKQSIGTTPDPEFDVPFNQAVAAKQTEQKKIGQGKGDAQVQAAQQPGGGGSSATGAVSPTPPPSPGEGVTEEQMRQSGRDN